MDDRSTPEEAWVAVTGKRNRRGGRRPKSTALNATGVEKHTPSLRLSAPLSVAEIQADHGKFARQWNDSPCCAKLKNILASRHCYPPPSKAICFGLGSFDPEDGSWQVRRRSHIQLASFITIVDCLEAQAECKIRCIFQEPCFTSADRGFLEGLNYEVVESPEGFAQVSEDTFLHGIHLYRDVYAAAISQALPAMFVGTGYQVWEGCAGADLQDFSRLKDLDETCDKAEFPDDNDFYPAFTSTTIHWLRRPPRPEIVDIGDAMGELSLSSIGD